MGKSLFSVIAAALFLVFPASLPAADLDITVAGVRNAQGTVRLVVHDKPEKFPSGDATAQLDLAARKGTVRGVMRGLAAGTYGLSLLHDENDNGRMDSNFIGLPKEGYGFSNDARVTLGPPSFAAAAFEVGPGRTSITVHVVY